MTRNTGKRSRSLQSPFKTGLACLILLLYAAGCSDTRLHQAVADDDVQLVQELIGEGADVNARDWKDNNPLHFVSSLRMATLLIHAGAEVQAKNKLGDTPLHLAAYFGNVEVVDLLIRMGADVDAKNEYGETPLHWSVVDSTPFSHLDQMSKLYSGRLSSKEGKVVVTRKFLETGVPPNGCTVAGETPLHYATQLNLYGDEGIKIIELLLKFGANVNARDINGRTPLGDQYSRPEPKVLELLRRHAASKQQQ